MPRSILVADQNVLILFKRMRGQRKRCYILFLYTCSYHGSGLFSKKSLWKFCTIVHPRIICLFGPKTTQRGTAVYICEGRSSHLGVRAESAWHMSESRRHVVAHSRRASSHTLRNSMNQPKSLTLNNTLNTEEGGRCLPRARLWETGMFLVYDASLYQVVLHMCICPTIEP